MLQAETLFRWTLRLFGIGILVLIALGVVEANFGDPPLLHVLAAEYVVVARILIPAVVFTGYFLVVCSLAIYALWKILQTNWRKPAWRLRSTE
jgi:hypothetical protein